MGAGSSGPSEPEASQSLGTASALPPSRIYRRLGVSASLRTPGDLMTTWHQELGLTCLDGPASLRGGTLPPPAWETAGVERQVPSAGEHSRSAEWSRPDC